MKYQIFLNAHQKCDLIVLKICYYAHFSVTSIHYGYSHNIIIFVTLQDFDNFYRNFALMCLDQFVDKAIIMFTYVDHGIFFFFFFFAAA